MLQNKRILYITGTMQVGGAEKQLINLVRGVKKVIENTTVAYFASGPLESEYKATNATLKKIEIGQGLFVQKLCNTWVNLQKFVDYIKPDIVHSQLPQTNILSCLAIGSNKRPLVIGERGMGVTRPIWEKALRRFAYTKASAFVTNSQAIKERMIRREALDRKKVWVIPNGVKSHESLGKEKTNIKREFGIPDQSIIVCAVGSLSCVKGFDVLIKAFAKLTADKANAYLIIAGEGNEREKLLDIAKLLKIEEKVKMPGQRSDISSLLETADIFVSTSHSEGISNSILEAMSAGIPTIATAVGGTKEIITDTVNGYLVPDNDINLIAKRLQQLAANFELREIVGTSAKAYVTSEYSNKRMVEKYISMYRQVLRAGSL